MNHLSSKISDYGKELVRLVGNYSTHKTKKGTYFTCVPPLQTERHLLAIYTKRHMVYEGEMFTGMNEEQLERLEKQVKALKLPDVFIVFVDSKLGQIYGQRLNQLKQIREYASLPIPFYKASHGGRLVLWPVIKMPHLFHIPEQQLNVLRDMQAENKSAANQTKLF